MTVQYQIEAQPRGADEAGSKERPSHSTLRFAFHGSVLYMRQYDFPDHGRYCRISIYLCLNVQIPPVLMAVQSALYLVIEVLGHPLEDEVSSKFPFPPVGYGSIVTNDPGVPGFADRQEISIQLCVWRRPWNQEFLPTPDAAST